MKARSMQKYILCISCLLLFSSALAYAGPLVDEPNDGDIYYNLSVDLNWDSGWYLYYYEIADNPAFSPMVTNCQTSESYSQYTLPGDGAYYFHMKGKMTENDEWDEFTDPIQFMVDTTPPTVPVLSLPANGALLNNNDVTLQWNASTDLLAVTYHIEVSGPATTSATGTSLSYMLNNCPDGVYTWYVWAADALYSTVPPAYQAAHRSANPTTFSFTVDITPPPTPGLLSPANNAVIADNTPTFTWNAVTDATSGTAGYQLRVYNGAVLVYSSNPAGASDTVPVGSELNNGTYTWIVRAVDNVGNVSGQTVWTLTVEVNDAAIAVTSPDGTAIWGPGGTNRNITWDVSGYWDQNRVRIWYSDDGGADGYIHLINDNQSFTGASGSYSWSLPNNVENSQYRIKIEKRNDNTVHDVSVDFEIDTKIPLPNPAAMSNAQALSSTAITWTAAPGTDAHAVEYYFEYQRRDVSDTSWEVTFTRGWGDSTLEAVGLAVNRRYRARVMMRDAVGNTGSYSSYMDSWTYANAPGSALYSNKTNASVRANWTANNNPSGTEYYCEDIGTSSRNSGWITSTNFTFSGLNPSTAYTFQVKARNQNDIETGWTNLGAVTTLGAPIVTVTSPDGGERWGGSHTITWTTSGYWGGSSITIELYVNGAFNATLVSGTPNDGAYSWNTASYSDTAAARIKVLKADEAGVSDISNGNFIIDNTAPGQPQLLSPGNNALLTDNTPLFDWNDVVDVSGITYQFELWNGAVRIVEVHGFSDSYYQIASALPDSNNYTWRVMAEDGAANQSVWSSIWSFRLDTTPPTGSIVINSGSAATQSQNVTLSLSASDLNGVSTMKISNVDSGWATVPEQAYQASVNWTLSSGEGNKTVYVRFKDIFGNWSGSFSDTIIFDATAPTNVGIQNPANGAMVDPVYTFLAYTANGGISGNVQYKFQLTDDSNQWSSHPGYFQESSFQSSSQWSPSLLMESSKTYYCRVQARDGAGNTSSFCGNAADAAGYVTFTTKDFGFIILKPLLDEVKRGTWEIQFQTFGQLTDINKNVHIKYSYNSTAPADFSTLQTFAILQNPSTYTREWNTLTAPPAQGDGTLYRIMIQRDSDPTYYAISNVFTIDNTGPAISALNPPDGQADVVLRPALSCSASDLSGIYRYIFEIARSDDFSSGYQTSGAIPGSTWSPGSDLQPDTLYYWRVTVSDNAVDKNGNRNTSQSSTRQFRTKKLELALIVPTGGEKWSGSRTISLRSIGPWSSDAVANKTVEIGYRKKTDAVSTFNALGEVWATGENIWAWVCNTVAITGAGSENEYYIMVRKKDLTTINDETDSPLIIDNRIPQGIAPLTPADGSFDVACSTHLVSTVGNGGLSGMGGYAFEIVPENPDFSSSNINVIRSSWTATNAWNIKLKGMTTYFWRVRGKDGAGNMSNWSAELTCITEKNKDIYFSHMRPSSSYVLHGNLTDLSIMLTLGPDVVDIPLVPTRMQCIIGHDLDTMLGILNNVTTIASLSEEDISILSAHSLIKHDEVSATFTLSNNALFTEGKDNYVIWMYDDNITSDIYRIEVAPNQAPEFEILQPLQHATVGKNPVIEIRTSDEGMGINPDSIVIRISDRQGDVIYSMQGNDTGIFDETTGIISFTYTEDNLQSGEEYQLYATGADQGYIRSLSAEDTAVFTVGKENQSIAEFLAYPSPFNPEREPITIRYTLIERSEVSMNLYDMGQELVAVIVHKEFKPAGMNESRWDGRDFAQQMQANGIYILELVVKDLSGEHRQYRAIAVLQ